MKRVTPDNITDVGVNSVFVFGSNLSGRHGKGAAKQALTWGAKWGQGIGLWGRTYAIPTKDASIRNALPLSEMQVYVSDFILHATRNPDKIYLVTEIGCGLARYKPKDIAPLFREAINIENIYLPARFWHKLSPSLLPTTSKK